MTFEMLERANDAIVLLPEWSFALDAIRIAVCFMHPLSQFRRVCRSVGRVEYCITPMMIHANWDIANCGQGFENEDYYDGEGSVSLG